MTNASFELVPGDAATGFLILCDHASNRIPPELGDLGLPRAQMERHIAYDIGARSVSLLLAEMLGCPAVLSTFSRLVIDPNRGEDDPTLVMRISDGAIIPGNADHDAEERERRLNAYYRPYDDAVGQAIDTAIAAGYPPTLVSIHSFTPLWKSAQRPWDIGILWDKDPRFAVPLIAALQAGGDLIVGDNEPYSGQLAGDMMHRQGTMRGLPHALIELRQDQVESHEGQARWANRLSDVITGLSGLEGLGQIRYYGSSGVIAEAEQPS
ncbi:MAG: N-formylglutamate amidohydrolase [Pseudomonadota bacterium]